MYKDTRKYVNFNGEEVTEDFLFNISQAELVDIQLTTPGGFQEYLTTISNSKDLPQIAKTFKEIIRLSYGEKSPDGKHFIKSDALSAAYMQTNAYSDFYMELISDPDKASAFITTILPEVPEDKKAEVQSKIDSVKNDIRNASLPSAKQMSNNFSK